MVFKALGLEGKSAFVIVVAVYCAVTYAHCHIVRVCSCRFAAVIVFSHMTLVGLLLWIFMIIQNLSSQD